MKLETDGIGYDLLERAIEAVKDVPGLFCEIGTRRGGSLQIAIDTAIRTGQYRHVISVDPYGNIPYNDGKAVTTYDYTNRMRFEAMAQLFTYVQDKPVNVVHFTLTDTDFFKAFWKGVPVYDSHRQLINQYAYVFLDGPHDTASVETEIDFFAERMPVNARMVIDNIDFFNLESVLYFAKRRNLHEVERNVQKICLCRL